MYGGVWDMMCRVRGAAEGDVTMFIEERGAP